MDTLALIVSDARAQLRELTHDYEELKRSAQQALTVSAVVLGLVLNMMSIWPSAKWSTLLMWQTLVATVLLLLSTAASLLLQLTTTFQIGYIKADYLYQEYSSQTPLELYRAQLSALLLAISSADRGVTRFSRAVNIVKVVIVLAVLLVGYVILANITQQ